jgi:hypothetical protein
MKEENENKLIFLEKEKNKGGQKSEKYFFKYAFPCAQIKTKLSSLSLEEYNKLKENFLENKCPNKKTLKKDFGAAFRRIKKLAEKMNKEMWDFEVIQEYWIKNHNEVIEQGDGMYGIASEKFKELCKIHEAEVIEINNQTHELRVSYNNKQRIVSNFLVQDIKIGDKVRIHFAFAVEKVD